MVVLLSSGVVEASARTEFTLVISVAFKDLTAVLTGERVKCFFLYEFLVRIPPS